MEERELNPSLPFAILDKQSSLVYANERMQKVLGLTQSSVPSETLENKWPFSNEEKSHLAVLKTLTSGLEQVLTTQAHLKTYKLRSFLWAKDRFLVVAEMMRSGDLLKDNPSRQVLFRTLSHEIRTSLMALEGYLQMLEPMDSDQKHLCQRMKDSVERLKKVVDRLKDLKEELKD